MLLFVTVSLNRERAVLGVLLLSFRLGLRALLLFGFIGYLLNNYERLEIDCIGVDFLDGGLWDLLIWF